jgi:hypothetical protein
VEAGHPALSQAAKATVQRILAAQPLPPEKVKYYLERRDPDFMAKMREILLVYREVDLQERERPRAYPQDRDPLGGRETGGTGNCQQRTGFAAGAR